MSDSNKLVLTAIIGILVGLVLGRLLWYSKTSLPDELPVSEEATTTEETPVVANPETEEAPAVTTEGESSVSVANQPAGSSVQVSLNTDQTVWVEVRDNNNGAMGNVLGAKHFAVGSTKVTVPLLRATEKGKSYFVALVPYLGSTLNYAISAVMKDASGKLVSASFTAK